MARKSNERERWSLADWLSIEMIAGSIAFLVAGAALAAGAVWLFWNGEQLLTSVATVAVFFIVGGLVGFLAVNGAFSFMQ